MGHILSKNCFPQLHPGCGLVGSAGVALILLLRVLCLLQPQPQPCHLGYQSGPRRCRVVGSQAWSVLSHNRLWERGQWPAILPFFILQAWCGGRKLSQVLPEPGSIRVRQILPPEESRVNGWSKPHNKHQAVPWAVFVTLTLIMLGIFIPMLPGGWKCIAYGVSFHWSSTCLLPRDARGAGRSIRRTPPPEQAPHMC